MSDEEEPKRERYNTSYLVGQIQTEQKRTKTIGFVVLGLLVVALIYFLFIRTPAPPEAPPPAPAAVAVPSPPPTAAPAVPAPAPAPVQKK